MSEENKNQDITPKESWKSVEVSEEVKEIPVGPGNDSGYAIKAPKKEENEVYKALQTMDRHGGFVAVENYSKFITLHNPEDPNIEWYFNKDMIQSIMPSKKEGYCVKLASGSKYTFTDISDIVTLRNLLPVPVNAPSFSADVSSDSGRLSDFFLEEEGKL